MAGQYERIEAHDDDDFESPQGPAPSHAIPSSPPPSFHSRASSIISSRDRSSHRDVDPDLADAFDTADELSDDDADDRQRLVRGPSHPAPAQSGAAAQANSNNTWARSRPAGSATHQDGANHAGQPQQQSDQSAAHPGAAPAPARTVPGRVYGSGIQSDGVFSNLSAKPERDNGEKDELPPSYEQAAADAAPPYWETTILAPGFGAPNDVYIDGLPVGSVFSFIWNGMISMSFQLVGFLLTYLLHSTHASKQGSRAGLGITFIQYGFYMKGNSDAHGGMGGAGSAGGSGDGYANPPDPNAHDFNPGSVQGAGGGGDGGGAADIASGDWAAFILMTVGWFVLLKSVSDFIKARGHEQLVLQSPDRGLGIPIIATGEGVETVV